MATTFEKLFIVLISIIFAIGSFFISFMANLGGLLIISFIIGCAIYRLGEDSIKRKWQPFKTWVGINLDEKRERLSDIDDKLYDISQENYILHSKDELIHKLKEEKRVIED